MNYIDEINSRNALQHRYIASAPLIPPPTCGGEPTLSGNFKVVWQGERWIRS